MVRLKQAIKENPVGWGLLIFFIVFAALSYIWIIVVPHPTSTIPDSVMPLDILEDPDWMPDFRHWF